MKLKEDEIHIKYLRLKDCKDEWLNLEKKNDTLSPLHYYDYMKILDEHYDIFKVRYLIKPIYIGFYKNNKCIAIAPMNESLNKKKLFSFGSHIGIAFNDWIYDSKMKKEVINKCIDLLLEKYKTIDFTRIPEYSLLYKCLNERTSLVRENINVNINTKKFNSYDEYFQSLSKNCKQKIRTNYNKIKRENKTISLEVIDGRVNEDIAKKVMDIYIKRRNQRYNRMSKIKEFILRKYHYNTIAMKEFDSNILFILKMDDEIMAFIQGYISKNKENIIAPRVSMNYKYSKFSPRNIIN